MNELRVFLGISDYHLTSHQVVIIIIQISNMFFFKNLIFGGYKIMEKLMKFTRSRFPTRQYPHKNISNSSAKLPLFTAEVPIVCQILVRKPGRNICVESRGLKHWPRCMLSLWCSSVYFRDFVQDEIRECCDDDLEQTQLLLHTDGNKEVETKLKTVPTHSQQLNRPKYFEVYTMICSENPTVMATNDPHLLPEQEIPIVIT